MGIPNEKLERLYRNVIEEIKSASQEARFNERLDLRGYKLTVLSL